MDEIRLEARAKINLGLDVLRRREDGYHEVKMVMQTVDIRDVLRFRKLEEDGIRLSTDKEELPGDESNLIWRAVRLMKDVFGIRQGVAVELEKRIPMAAGMAGGSADAAAAIHGVDRLFSLGLSLEEKQRLGVKIGADVPYCLMGGTALAEGIGERLTPLPAPPDAFLVIAKPDIDVSTAFVYSNLRADALPAHPDIDGMVRCIRNKDLKGIAARMENVLETVTVGRYPVVEEIKAFLKERGALNALMSGSGPTVFGVYEERESAERAYGELKGRGLAKQVFLTGFAE